MKHSPDYKEMSMEKARKDYLLKIDHYTEQYETIDEKVEGHYSYIKLINAGKKSILFLLIFDFSL